MCLMHRHHGDPRVGGGRAGGKQVAGYKYMEVVASAMAVVRSAFLLVCALPGGVAKPVLAVCRSSSHSGLAWCTLEKAVLKVWMDE